MSLFNQSLFRVALEGRLGMSPAENTRWLEIVQTATTHKKLREEAVIATTRRISDIYPTRIRDTAHRSKKKETQRGKSRGEKKQEERRGREEEKEQEE